MNEVQLGCCVRPCELSVLILTGLHNNIVSIRNRNYASMIVVDTIQKEINVKKV